MNHAPTSKQVLYGTAVAGYRASKLATTVIGRVFSSVSSLAWDCMRRLLPRPPSGSYSTTARAQPRETPEPPALPELLARTCVVSAVMRADRALDVLASVEQVPLHARVEGGHVPGRGLGSRDDRRNPPGRERLVHHAPHVRTHPWWDSSDLPWDTPTNCK